MSFMDALNKAFKRDMESMVEEMKLRDENRQLRATIEDLESKLAAQAKLSAMYQKCGVRPEIKEELYESPCEPPTPEMVEAVLVSYIASKGEDISEDAILRERNRLESLTDSKILENWRLLYERKRVDRLLNLPR